MSTISPKTAKVAPHLLNLDRLNELYPRAIEAILAREIRSSNVDRNASRWNAPVDFVWEEDEQSYPDEIAMVGKRRTVTVLDCRRPSVEGRMIKVIAAAAGLVPTLDDPAVLLYRGGACRRLQVSAGPETATWTAGGPVDLSSIRTRAQAIVALLYALAPVLTPDHPSWRVLEVDEPWEPQRLSGTVIVCGGRDYWDSKRVYTVLDHFSLRHDVQAIRHGACGWDAKDGGHGDPTLLKGADRSAHEWAVWSGVAVDPVPARWAEIGRGAGPVRNALMLKRSPAPCCLIAFPGRSGTKGMIRLAEKAGIPVFQYN